MRYKKPKYSNMKKFSGKSMSGREPMSNKRKLIIGIIIAAVVLLIAAAVIVALLIINHDGAGNNDPVIQPPIDSVESSEIKNIQIAKFPNQRLYYCGDELDVTGLQIFALTQGGAFIQVNVADCTITGFDSTTPVEKQTITVKYREFTDTFAVEIKEKPVPVYALESIALENPPKTEYKLGEWLNTDGGTFICTYTDGTTKTVELKNKYVSGFKPAMDAGVGEYDLRIIYSENGVKVETTYKIKITQ